MVEVEVEGEVEVEVEVEDEEEEDVEDREIGCMDRSWRSVGPVMDAEERMKREETEKESSVEV